VAATLGNYVESKIFPLHFGQTVKASRLSRYGTWRGTNLNASEHLPPEFAGILAIARTGNPAFDVPIDTAAAITALRWIKASSICRLSRRSNASASLVSSATTKSSPVRPVSSSAEPPIRRHEASVRMTASITEMGRGSLLVAINRCRMVTRHGRGRKRSWLRRSCRRAHHLLVRVARSFFALWWRYDYFHLQFIHSLGGTCPLWWLCYQGGTCRPIYYHRGPNRRTKPYPGHSFGAFV
jgi:hypothetical protein